MAEQEDFIGLNWVRTEVEHSLEEARQALDAYLEQPADNKRLVFCQARFHQIQGSLKMLPQKGASLLIEELQATTDSLINNQTTNSQLAVETLIQGVLQLSAYIEKVVKSGEDNPVQLLELLNALRSLRHSQSLTPLDFFHPEYGNKAQPLDNQQLDHLIQSGAIKLIRKIRQKYQICLASYLRQKEPEQSLSLMNKLFGKLQNLCWGSPSSSLWDAGAALVEGLSEQSIKPTEFSNRLLKELDNQLKQVVESNGLEINQPPSQLFLKKILYLIATADGSSQLIQTQKKRYQLVKALPSGFPDDPGHELSQLVLAPDKIKIKQEIHSSELQPLAMDGLHKIAVLEARTEISHVSQAITDYLTNNRPVEYLSKVPILLNSAYSTLNMAPMTACAELLKRTASYTESTWLRENVKPSKEQMTAVEQGLASITDYCNALTQGDMQDAELHIEKAKQTFDNLDLKTSSAQQSSLGAMTPEELKVIPNEEPEKKVPEKEGEIAVNKTELTFEFTTSEQDKPDTVSLKSKPESKSETGVTIDPQVDKTGDKSTKAPAPQQKTDLVSLFVGTVNTVQEELNTKFSIWKKNPRNTDSLKIIRRSFNTLKNSARSSGANVIGELASAVENMLNRLLSGTIKPSSNMVSLLKNIIIMLPDLTRDFASNNQLLTPEVLLFMEQADDLARGEAFFDPDELEGIDAAEATVVETNQESVTTENQTTKISVPEPALTSDIEVLLSADGYLEKWTTAISSKELKRFMQELKMLSEKASAAKTEPLALLCNVLLDVCHYLGLHEKSLPSALFTPLQQGFETLVDLLNQVAAKQTVTPPQSIFSLIKQSLESLLKEKHQRKRVKPKPANKNAFEEIVLEASEERVKKFKAPKKKRTEPKAPAELDLIKLFMEEAHDLMESCAQALDSWLRHDNSVRPVAELQRNLHTLKGGARMAEFDELGNLSHALESVYEAIVTGQRESSEAPLGLLQQSHDLIDNMLQAISRGETCPPAEPMIKQLEQWNTKAQKSLSHTTSDNESSKPPLPDYLGRASNKSPLSGLSPQNIKDHHRSESIAKATGSADSSAVPSDEHSLAKVQAKINAFKTNAESQSPSFIQDERIRVTSDLVEQLVNLTDESSIHRSQIEQQMLDITHNLSEMDSTIFRLKEQLRRLDTETHSQIISKHGDATNKQLEFDPLEMDQYSELTQLSTALVESASDLVDLQQSLQEKSRVTESLLLQQSRTQSQLQTQLLQVRLVPFNRLLPRLQKTVRQVSTELSRPVELHVKNADVKIDRTTLDKIQAPIEHILRNAITHGIEQDLEVRQQKGKPAKGQLLLALSYEGSHITIAISDDGQGVNLQAIKNKAIEKDLIAAEADPSESTLLNLMMTAGFSTASQITQVSGRGVGLDVVSNEVRKLGGSIQIESKPEQGTRFVLQLPFRSSVSRALMIEEEGNLYAIPMQSIDSLIMVSPRDLLASYTEGKHIEHAGIKHKVISFGQLLGLAPTKIQPEHCPLIIIQRGGENIALHVDTIHGGREIITKSLGPQFKELTGVNGATILGEGRIVIIVDPAEMIRKHHGQLSGKLSHPALPDTVQPHKTQRILIVDDSITMRKVTSQLLSRHDYQVDSARNGVEAMNLIAENRPDLILLDVEMPKMDGFEVASAIRNDPKLSSLPIIMITSRTGTKHRDRALSLGVNEYIGKPFQESLLLQSIKKLISTSEPGN